MPDFFINSLNLIVEVRGKQGDQKVINNYQRQQLSLVSYPTRIFAEPKRALRYMFISMINDDAYRALYGTAFITEGDGSRHPVCIEVNNNRVNFGKITQMKARKSFTILGFEDYSIKVVPSKLLTRCGYDLTAPAEELFTQLNERIIESEFCKFIDEI